MSRFNSRPVPHRALPGHRIALSPAIDARGKHAEEPQPGSPPRPVHHRTLPGHRIALSPTIDARGKHSEEPQPGSPPRPAPPQRSLRPSHRAFPNHRCAGQARRAAPARFTPQQEANSSHARGSNHFSPRFRPKYSTQNRFESSTPPPFPALTHTRRAVLRALPFVHSFIELPRQAPDPFRKGCDLPRSHTLNPANPPTIGCTERILRPDAVLVETV